MAFLEVNRQLKVNLENVAYIRSQGDSRVEVHFIGTKDPLSLTGLEARNFLAALERESGARTAGGAASA